MAADIAHNAVKKIIPLCVEGAKILDICIEGDKFIEQGTGAVWKQPVRGVRVLKGGFSNRSVFRSNFLKRSGLDLRSRLPHLHQREQLRRALFSPRVSRFVQHPFGSKSNPQKSLNA